MKLKVLVDNLKIIFIALFIIVFFSISILSIGYFSGVKAGKDIMKDKFEKETIEYPIMDNIDTLAIYELPRTKNVYQIIIPSSNGAMAFNMFISKNDLIKIQNRISVLINEN